jgi:hypothetical protein
MKFIFGDLGYLNRIGFARIHSADNVSAIYSVRSVHTRIKDFLSILKPEWLVHRKEVNMRQINVDISPLYFRSGEFSFEDFYHKYQSSCFELRVLMFFS